MGIKTHSGASKRMQVTGGGKVKCKHSFKRHNLRKRSKKAKRQLTHTAYINETEMPRVKLLLNL